MKEATTIHSTNERPEFFGDGDPDNEYLGPRGFMQALGENHWAILRDTQPFKEYATKYPRILAEALNDNDSNPPILWIPDSDNYFLDELIRDSLTEVTRQLPPGDYNLQPYSNLKRTRDWVASLNEESTEHTVNLTYPPASYNYNNPQHRGGWGKIYNHEQTPFPEENEIPYPPSYIVSDHNNLMQAYSLITEAYPAAWLKPIWASGGFANRKITSPDEITEYLTNLRELGLISFKNQPMPIEVQAHLPNITGFFSLQYFGERIITPNNLTQQIIQSGTYTDNWVGNIFNTVPEPTIEQALEIWRKFVDGMQNFYSKQGKDFKDPGGLDFAEIETDEGKTKLIVLENNGGRETGAWPAIAIANILNLANQPFLATKLDIGEHIPLDTFWELLKDNNLAIIHPQLEGVFPLNWVPLSHQVLITARREEEIYTFQETLNNILT